MYDLRPDAEKSVRSVSEIASSYDISKNEYLYGK